MANQSNGENFAKVLKYYGLINDFTQEQKIVCPFHEDVNPSMLIDLCEGKYYCFGCSRFGDAKMFVQELEHKLNGLNDLQGLVKYYNILKSEKGIKLNFHRHKHYSEASKLFLTMAEDYYYCLSNTNWCISEPLTRRVVEYMKKRGFSEKTLTRVGAKLTYNNSYPIIFPVLDNGEFKGYVCRTTDKEIEKKRKYLYNEGFSRATTVVGNYHSSTVIVVEGYMDMLKLIQFGETNAVALFGWKATSNQIEKLKKAGITKIICATDNDECGIKGYKYLQHYFQTKRFAFPKQVKDIGEMTIEMYKECKSKTKKSKWCDCK